MTQRPFAQAAWAFLGFCEELILHPLIRALIPGGESLTEHEQAALADNVIVTAKWPMYWLHSACPTGGTVPRRFDETLYQAAWDLSRLADEYTAFESAFTYASNGVIGLSLEDRRLVASNELRRDSRFDAYDRLAAQDFREHVPSDSAVLSDVVGLSVRVTDDWFEYQLNPRIVARCIDWAGATLEDRFTLPGDWEFEGVRLAEYQAVFRSLWAISAIHFCARVVATTQGCRGLGAARALVVMPPSELISRLTRYSAVRRDRVAAIVDSLTYGKEGGRFPDPAFQPLVSLGTESIAWSPHLVLNNSLERNLVVLLNRRPSSRAMYMRVSQQKEERLRMRMEAAVSRFGCRTWHGQVPGWTVGTDLDLVVIRDTERTCLCLELKSFVAPAEPREIWERTEEIERGIDQLLARRAAFSSAPDPLREALSVSADYDFFWAVVSETSIGAGWIDRRSTPVINADHLIARMAVAPSLGKTCLWLQRDEYLPVSGREFEAHDMMAEVDGWSLEWFGITVAADAALPIG